MQMWTDADESFTMTSKLGLFCTVSNMTKLQYFKGSIQHRLLGTVRR